jgi:hypothetical protein
MSLEVYSRTMNTETSCLSVQLPRANALDLQLTSACPPAILNSAEAPTYSIGFLLKPQNCLTHTHTHTHTHTPDYHLQWTLVPATGRPPVISSLEASTRKVTRFHRDSTPPAVGRAYASLCKPAVRLLGIDNVIKPVQNWVLLHIRVTVR